MAKMARSKKLLKSAEAALIAAIEIYNKPDFRYREETFSILMLNAWELILRAKLLEENGNNPRCIYVYEKRTTSAGKESKKQYLRRNRAGNIHTIGLKKTIAELDKMPATKIPDAIKRNIDALTEIRDNAIHYVNASPQLAKQVLEIGTASVKNFVHVARSWFDDELSSCNLYLMPIGFVASSGTVTALTLNPDEENLVGYLREIVRNSPDSEQDYHVSLEVNLSFKRSPSDAIASVRVTNDPDAPEVTLTEEDIRKRYPWDYGELTERLKKRYIDFKANNRYHGLRKPLMKDPKFVRSRFLDPGNPRSARKDFYNSNILVEFDKHYTRRS